VLHHQHRLLVVDNCEHLRAALAELVVALLGPGDVAAVTSICCHLDGIPLEPELAAGRAGALNLQEIEARLTGCMELLARTGAGPARQQTLRASVEWSHQLLSERERAVFRRLAVFVGAGRWRPGLRQRAAG
jgi:predicted ATPase